MNLMKRILDLLFDEEMKFATRGAETIRFSKTERLLLSALTKNRGRLMSRQALLDIIAAGDDDKSDRNIDYVVNRLRNKLKDSARAPRYLATRYGEGYVWLASTEQADLSDAFLVIGPAYGLQGETFEPHIKDLIQRLRQNISRKLSPDRKVAVAPGIDTLADRAEGSIWLNSRFCMRPAESTVGRS
jgi:DNA-binding winged helix-turn-helix (wHTH) protein